jgi:signal transduction histidine kinase
MIRSVQYAFTRSAVEHRRLWLGLAVASTCAIAAVQWIRPFGPVTGEPAGLLAAVVLTVVLGFGFLFSATNSWSSRQLRLALVLLAASYLLVAFGNFLRLMNALGVAFPVIPNLDVLSELAIWALCFVALVRIPLAPIAPQDRWRVSIDIAVSFIGMMLVLAVIWLLPGLRSMPEGARHRLMFFDLMEAGNLFILNMIVVRGSSPEIRSAIRWMAAGFAGDTLYLIVYQCLTGYQDYDGRLLDAGFFVVDLVYLVAAYHFLTGPEQPSRSVNRIHFSQLVNPLPFCAVMTVGGLLIITALKGQTESVAILSLGIVVMTLLLLARVVLATRQSVQVENERFKAEQRMHDDKMALVRQLAGGISHVINNQMTAVIVNADLLRTESPYPPDGVAKLEGIDSAARKASRLAARLLLASGGSVNPVERRDRLAEVVLYKREAVQRLVGIKRDVSWEVPPGAGDVRVAPSDIDVILTELVTNPVEATYHAGKIAIRVYDEEIEFASPEHPLVGRFCVLEVSDTGRGIAKDDLPRVGEPFFSRKPSSDGRGLGLSVIHGIVSRYGGTLRIETLPEAGSRVRAYFPAASA